MNLDIYLLILQGAFGNQLARKCSDRLDEVAITLWQEMSVDLLVYVHTEQKTEQETSTKKHLHAVKSIFSCLQDVNHV